MNRALSPCSCAASIPDGVAVTSHSKLSDKLMRVEISVEAAPRLEMGEWVSMPEQDNPHMSSAQFYSNMSWY